MGLLGDILGDIEGALDSLEDVVNAIENAVKSGEKVLGTVLSPLGSAIQYVVNGVAYELGDLIGIHMRSLTNDERNILRGVFLNTVPVDKILLTSIPGKDGRPFTVPGSMVTVLSFYIPVVGPLIALGSLVDDLEDKYLINVGGMYSDHSLLPSSYDTNMEELRGSLLVHESTHVWQGVHSAFSWWYVFNSLYFQFKNGANAYAVDETHLQTWASYEVEQQAHLVEDWYSRGSKITDSNYPFIRDNIRPARPFAKTRFDIEVSPLQAGQATSLASAMGQPTTPVIGRPAATAAFRPGASGIR